MFRMFGSGSTAKQLYNQTASSLNRGMSTSSEFTKLGDLTPLTSAAGGNLKLRAKIISKFPPKSWEKNGRSGKLLGLVISDGENKTKATVFSGVDQFDQVVQPGKTYCFTNFTVRDPLNRQYHNFVYPYEINFSETTTIEETEDASANIDLSTVRVTSLDLIAAHLKAYTVKVIEAQAASQGGRVPSENYNVMGVVQSVSPLESFVSKKGKQVTKREIEIVDGSMTKIKLILWGDIATKCTEDLAENHSVILIQGVSFNSFGSSVTVSTDFDAAIAINPSTDISRALASWYKTEGINSSFVETITSTDSFARKSVLISTIDDDEIARAGDKAVYYTITGTILAIRKPTNPDMDDNTQRRSDLYYNACSECLKKVSEDTFSSTCPMCSKPLVTTKRYILTFAFADGSGQRWLTAFSKEAEKIIGIEADQLAVIRANDPDQFERILADITHRSFTLRVRGKVEQGREYNDNVSIRLTVVNVYHVDVVKESQEKMNDIEDMHAHGFTLDYIS